MSEARESCRQTRWDSLLNLRHSASVLKTFGLKGQKL